MKSFKYKGTPEQMAKVAEWALKNGAKWAAGSPADFNWISETKGFGVVLTETGSLFYIDFYDTTGEPALRLTPHRELEIFGSTQGITGNPENKPAEEYFVQPKTEKTLEDAYDNLYTDVEYEADMAVVSQLRDRRIKSDGGPTDYYALTIKTKDGEFKCQVGDVIRAMVGNDFDLGNVVKATRRIWCDAQGYGKEGIDMGYDVKKINYFTNEFYEANK